MTEPLRRTHLYQWHVDHGGRMVPFAGWEMPVQYPSGPIQEHHTTRQIAGLFDIDHMGQVEVRGVEAEAFVNKVVSYDITQMKLFDAHYAIFCYKDGTCVDDLFVYKLPDPKFGNYFFLAINASNRFKDVAWLKAHVGKFDATVTDISDETYMMAFQGPKAPEILTRLADADLVKPPRFTAVQTKLLGNVPVLLGRTGYTGEDGYELFVPVDSALKVWEGILKVAEPEGVKPIGLAARDSLRFEACMPLYGHEINAEITPVEARLGFALSLEKHFIGRDGLLKQKLEGPRRVLVGFEMVERGLAREHYPVWKDGKEVGHVTSGMFAPTLDRYLGMALLPVELAATGTEIEIMIRNKPVKAKVVKRPFYIPAYRR
jgi:glycine cleavage system T protein (aminomethyltransferase)